MPLRVGVLGPVTVWRDGHEVMAGQPRQLAVLGVLASRANQVVSRGELVDAVWGDQPPATVDNGIYTYVAGLRRVLEPDRPRRDQNSSRRAPSQVLVSSGGGYLLRLGPGGLDANEFEDCLSRSRELRAAGDLRGAARVVDEALGLWRGQPFAGVPGPFAEAERLRLTELRTTAAEERADLMLAEGQPAAAVPELTTLVAEHPLRERARGLLMIALYRCGRQAEALRAFHDARERLAEDLGIDPGTELSRIHQRVLAMDPTLDTPARRRPGRAVWLPLRAAGSAPPPAPRPGGSGRPRRRRRRPARRAPSPAQLPPEPAGFVGRTAELDWLHALLPGASASPAGTLRLPGRADHRDRRRRQDHAGDPLRPAGRAAVPRRPAVREPARLRPGEPADEAGHGAAVVLRRARGLRRDTCRRPWRRRARCCARCSTASGCCCCSTTRTTPTRCGRCCPAARAAWCW